jgi:hypothetical protein
MSIPPLSVIFRSCLLFVSIFFRMLGVSFVIATITAKNYVYSDTLRTRRSCALTKKTRGWTYTITYDNLLKTLPVSLSPYAGQDHKLSANLWRRRTGNSRSSSCLHRCCQRASGKRMGERFRE